jgi:hypothetical protein
MEANDCEEESITLFSNFFESILVAPTTHITLHVADADDYHASENEA